VALVFRRKVSDSIRGVGGVSTIIMFITNCKGEATMGA
jgi:hypothetical protein